MILYHGSNIAIIKPDVIDKYLKFTEVNPDKGTI